MERRGNVLHSNFTNEGKIEEKNQYQSPNNQITKTIAMWDGMLFTWWFSCPH